ncbi:MAG TPA: hypothetical protein DCF89_03665 [Flavobacteriales bacterium]|nr:hypothetical protein [Flavobacteriales bacterium]
MLNDDIPATTKPLFEDLQMGSPLPDDKPEIVNRKAEAKRVINRISGIILEHREASLQLNVVLGWNELSIVINALRDHAQGGQGILQLAGLDEIQAHCINRLYEELVEEPSNILYSTPTGPSTTRYDSMEPSFWIECLDLLENEILKSTSN